MPVSSNKHDYPENIGNTRWGIIISLVLVLCVLIVFLQVRWFEFINYDDPLYVTGNPVVKAGLNPDSFRWALSTPVASNYHPITMLSHMLDCRLYGMNAGQHHMTNMLLHMINTWLLFFVLKRMTGSLWSSALVAFLFGLHPLHVESVAWVSERKDVLCTFFWLAVMWAYNRYVKNPGFFRYVPIVIFFVLGLLSKPMLVTLPFVLVLLDYWPLGRLCEPLSGSRNRHVFIEKIPLFLISAVFCIITFAVQKSGGSIVAQSVYPLDIRISNALISYVIYLIKMFCPIQLAVIYPHPGVVLKWQAAGAFLIMFAITLAALKFRKNTPYFIIGWLWFVGTLVPVIGIVQVGSQAMADRYTYVPLIGLFVAMAWGLLKLAAFHRYFQKIIAGFIIVALLLMMLKTTQQVALWQNSITLFTHATRVTANNAVAHKNLGLALAEKGRLDESYLQFLEVTKIRPDSAEAHHNVGTYFMLTDRPDQALRHYKKVLEIDPGYEKTHNNMGLIFLRQEKINAAISSFRKALDLKPDYVEANTNLTEALSIQKP